MPRVARIAAAGLAWFVAACGGGGGAESTQPIIPIVPAGDTTPLRVLAAGRHMLLGAAIDRGFRYPGSDGVQFRSVFARELNVLTPENDMKFDHLHPARNTYRFESADSLVAFAEQNGMKVRGHTLVWHQQLPAWVTSGAFSQDTARAILADHIATVVGHYKGRILEWDVVNEAFNDDGTRRVTPWSTMVGPDYIERAFRAARAADSTVGLFYNDYNIEGIGPKSDSVYAMAQDFLARGVPITGIGFQSHFVVGGVPSSLAANVARFAALGLQVHFTELDVRMQLPATQSSLDIQAQNYRDVVSVCMQSPACNTVVMWGLTDKESWVPGTFPGWGAALILDAQYQPKPAYTALRTLLE